jgi:hypothetical protein
MANNIFMNSILNHNFGFGADVLIQKVQNPLLSAFIPLLGMLSAEFDWTITIVTLG